MPRAQIKARTGKRQAIVGESGRRSMCLGQGKWCSKTSGVAVHQPFLCVSHVELDVLTQLNGSSPARGPLRLGRCMLRSHGSGQPNGSFDWAVLGYNHNVTFCEIPGNFRGVCCLS